MTKEVIKQIGEAINKRVIEGCGKFQTFSDVKNTKSKSFKIFGLRFEIWKVVQGYRLSVDTKTTRYIFKPFWYTGKCKVADLV